MSKATLQASLNLLREKSSQLLQETIPEVTETMDISELSSAVFDSPQIKNEFINNLIDVVVEQQVTRKVFTNRLKFLEGDRLPLGRIVEDIYINPVKGRNFDADDYAGILEKYEADVKVQYLPLNMDRQYPITISDQMLKKAFLNWGAFEDFITGLTNALYSGAYIDEYMYTKGVVSSAYQNNVAIIEKVSNISTESSAKDFIARCRTLYKDFQNPSSKFNAWNKAGGNGRPVLTWTEPENIIFLIRNDISSYIDVNVLASAFNIDKSKLLGNIEYVDNFDMYNDNGELEFDGQNIVGLIADKSWFKIRTQDFYMDNGKNANNRTWNYYLNYIKMYKMSLFANGVIFATELPSGIPCTELKVLNTDLNISKEVRKTLYIESTPPTTTDKLQVTTTASNVTANVIDNNKIEVTISSSYEDETLQLTLTCGSISKTVTLTVK